MKTLSNKWIYLMLLVTIVSTIGVGYVMMDLLDGLVSYKAAFFLSVITSFAFGMVCMFFFSNVEKWYNFYHAFPHKGNFDYEERQPENRKEDRERQTTTRLRIKYKDGVYKAYTVERLTKEDFDIDRVSGSRHRAWEFY